MLIGKLLDSSDRTLKKTAHLIESLYSLTWPMIECENISSSHSSAGVSCQAWPAHLDAYWITGTASRNYHPTTGSYYGWIFCLPVREVCLSNLDGHFILWKCSLRSMGSWRRSARKTRLSRLHVSITQIPILKMAHDGLYWHSNLASPSIWWSVIFLTTII